MSLRDNVVDVQIGNLRFETPFMDTAMWLRDDKTILIERIPTEIADKLMAMTKEKRIMQFPFKAQSKGLSIDTTIEIDVIGYAVPEDRYYLTFKLV